MLQVTMLIGDNVMATAAVLGDPRNETPEAMAERHERVVSSSLLALGGLLRLTCAEPSSAVEDGAKGRNRVYDSVAGVLKQPGFWSRNLKSAQAVVRRSAYVLVVDIVGIRCVCVHGLLLSKHADGLWAVREVLQSGAVAYRF